jgi:type IV pilus assembly protein PilN
VIKINLIREARPATREGAGSRPVAGGASQGVSAGAGMPRELNSILIIGLLLFGLLVGGGYWFWKSRTLKNKQEQVVTNRAEAQKLEAIIAEVEQFQKRKESLEKRIALINQLKQSQKGPVKVMDKISALLPDLVWLTSMKVAGTSIDLQGKALNPNAVANYIENIKSDAMFDEPVLREVSQGQEGTAIVYSWSMTFNFKYDDAQQPAAAAGGTPAAGG